MRPPQSVLLVSPLLVLALVVAGTHAPSAETGATRGVVATVADGDTVSLRSRERIRLVQIDAPESGECYGAAARAELAALLPRGSSVRLERDPALDDVDRFGRSLRYVRRGGANVNLELVRRGAAAPYFYAGERGRYASQLVAAARVARGARRGLWRACPGALLDPYRQLDTGRERIRPIAPVVGGACDRSYTGACVPAFPPDLDCDDLRARGLSLPVRVVGDDPHRLDGDGDGWGCE